MGHFLLIYLSVGVVGSIAFITMGRVANDASGDFGLAMGTCALLCPLAWPLVLTMFAYLSVSALREHWRDRRRRLNVTR